MYGRQVLSWFTFNVESSLCLIVITLDTNYTFLTIHVIYFGNIIVIRTFEWPKKPIEVFINFPWLERLDL